MRKLTRIACVAGLSVCLAILLYVQIGDNGASDGPRCPFNRGLPAVQPEESPVDEHDNPHARLQWELGRLVDPTTGRIPDGIRARELDFASGLPEWPAGSLPGGTPSRNKVNGWGQRGPYNIGGRTRALAIDVSDPTYQTLLAGGVSGGLWRSTDDGASWTMTVGGSSLHNINCIAQDTRPGHEDVWYYGTGEGQRSYSDLGPGPRRGDGIFKSLDGGLTWAVLPATSTNTPQTFDNPFNYVGRIVIDPSNLVQEEVYAATWGVIYRSIDRGATWTPVLGDETQLAKYTDVAITSTGRVYASLSSEGGVSGIYVSDDGVVWSDITPALTPDYGRIVLAVSPSNETKVYALAAWPTTSDMHELWLYTWDAGGGSWQERSGPLDQLPIDWPWGQSDIIDMTTQRGYNLALTVGPTNTAFVYLGGVHLWRNFAGFTNTNTARIGGWYYLDRNHHADQHDVVFQPGSSSIAYTATDGGVYKTTNINATDVAWTSLNNGYNTTQYYTVAIDPDLPGNEAIVGGLQDNGTLWTGSHNSTSTWLEVFGGDGAHCAILDGSADGDYLVSYYYANIYRLRLNSAGTTINSTRVNPDAGGDGFVFINPFITDPADDHVVYMASNNGVWRNTDITGIPWGGSAPDNTNWGKLTTLPADESVSAMAANGMAGHDLYYGTAAGGLYRIDDVVNAPDGSAPVALHGNAPFPAGAYVSGISVDPNDNDKVLICFSNYSVSSLWYTEDAGGTWTETEGNLSGDDGPSIRSVGILPIGPSNLYLVGTSTGLYSTWFLNDSQTLWNEESGGLIGHVEVEALALRPSDGLVVAGTYGRGVFSAYATAPVAIPEVASSHLAQNVPNPFNPRTRMEFRLELAGHARLDVLDLRGRRVSCLLDRHLVAGDHFAEWDGTDDAGRGVAAGTYVYRLQGPGVDEQKTMVLVK